MSTPVAVTEVSPNYFTLDATLPVAKELSAAIKWYSPRFSPKDVPRFYDISSLTEAPALFNSVVDVMAQRYRDMGAKAPTHIIGFDARGFLLGTPIALKLNIPFVLLRKAAKSPGVLVQSDPYTKEYLEHAADTQAIRLGSIPAGARVVLIDDLIATGGTAISGFQLVEALGATVVEFAAIIGIPFLDGVGKIHTFADGAFKNVPVFTLIHDSSVKDENCGDPTAWPADLNRVINVNDAKASDLASSRLHL